MPEELQFSKLFDLELDAPYLSTFAAIRKTILDDNRNF
jgi:hypothetical protein